MRAQGIKGPSYRFFHGNTKEVAFMRIQAAKLPMELSHHVLPRFQPHIYSWTKLYSKARSFYSLLCHVKNRFD
ncbi:hypothetical protein LINPERPRIM_LOCUS26141 [Linum perenne]